MSRLSYEHTFFFLQVLQAVELALLETLARLSAGSGHSQFRCPLQHCVQAGLFSSHLTYTKKLFSHSPNFVDETVWKDLSRSTRAGIRSVFAL